MSKVYILCICEQEELGFFRLLLLYIYISSSKTKFRYRANNYKSTHRKFKNKKPVLKEALIGTMVFKIG